VDFLRLVRSLEELLYEVMTWLVFYPRTLWRILAHPLATTRYTEDEEAQEAAEQYTDTLSPPLLLMLTILIAHGVELALGAKLPRLDTPVAKALLGTEQSLLVFRALAFSIFPLVAATTLLARRGVALDRRSLRAPFFSQCYLAAPLTLAFSVGSVLARTASGPWRLAGVALSLAGVGWYLGVEAGWFGRQLPAGAGRAVGLALWSFATAVLYWALLGTALSVLVA
jgi:hypothetical protein